MIEGPTTEVPCFSCGAEHKESELPELNGQLFCPDCHEGWVMMDNREELEPEVTEWFPLDVAPVREGAYQVTDNKNPNWPFPTYADWDGQKWSDDSIAQWRGLAKDPNK
jgi:hypothetical protein